MWPTHHRTGAGLDFDTTSAGALAASLRTLKGDSSNAATAEILQLLFTKPMQVCALLHGASLCHTVRLDQPRRTHSGRRSPLCCICTGSCCALAVPVAAANRS